uniref:Uncharacterized protein n=1 Tax=Ficedula albicollis TaxID=59894 RepID=A0A803VGC6_FICAL
PPPPPPPPPLVLQCLFSLCLFSLVPCSALDSPGRLDEEHRLIARYAARLAAEAGSAPRPPADLGFSFDANKQQRQLIAELENKNRYSPGLLTPCATPTLPALSHPSVTH